MNAFDDDDFCDECESPNLVAKISDHDSTIMEYYCRNKSCGANWVEHVSNSA